ncbi:hypothetical protein [Rhodococcus qingshengii]|uniref:hypothetical protein n=1 Tax=Rhodococcus qingshengii TaxID=334542 RepID=UPI001C8B861B|nr:hypothetical protein [Rhodococcus qingshengii]MBX9150062.1 hypothetical protein [Rhodococcus qingshengii]
MKTVTVEFRGSDPEISDLTRRALQPVLDSIYRSHRRMPQPIVEATLKHAGRGSFARERIEQFAVCIADGKRPILTE